jgi:hypothetical protein
MQRPVKVKTKVLQSWNIVAFSGRIIENLEDWRGLNFWERENASDSGVSDDSKASYESVRAIICQ